MNMKKMYFFLAMLLIVLGVNAQSFRMTYQGEEYVSNDTLKVEVVPGEESKSFFFLTNITENPIDTYVRYEKTMGDDNTEFLMCFGNCTESNFAGPVALEPNVEYTEFDIAYYPANTNTVIIKVEILKASATEGEYDALETFYVKYYDEVGLEQQVKATNLSLSAYPNPAVNNVKLSYSIPSNYSNAEISVRNMVGKTVKTIPAKIGVKSVANISTMELPNGVYFYSIVADGVTLSTKKLVVRH